MKNGWKREYEVLVTDDEKPVMLKGIDSSDDAGVMVMNTGCTKGVAGAGWHAAKREALAVLGLKPLYVASFDKFRFGNKRTGRSIGAWIYPAGNSSEDVGVM
eukprot:3639653-Alexandrium_andersonii.AAC.1